MKRILLNQDPNSRDNSLKKKQRDPSQPQTSPSTIYKPGLFDFSLPDKVGKKKQTFVASSTGAGNLRGSTGGTQLRVKGGLGTFNKNMGADSIQKRIKAKQGADGRLLDQSVHKRYSSSIAYQLNNSTNKDNGGQKYNNIDGRAGLTRAPKLSPLYPKTTTNKGERALHSNRLNINQFVLCQEMTTNSQWDFNKSNMEVIESKKFLQSPRQIFSQERPSQHHRQQQYFGAETTNSTQNRFLQNFGQELTDDSLFENQQFHQSQARRADYPFQNVRNNSKGSKWQKTPSNLSSQIRNSSSGERRNDGFMGTQTGMVDLEKSMMGPQIDQREVPTLAGGGLQRRQKGLSKRKYSKKNRKNNLKQQLQMQNNVNVTDEIIVEVQRSTPMSNNNQAAVQLSNVQLAHQRGKTQHSKLRHKILSNQSRDETLVADEAYNIKDKPDTVHSNRQKIQKQLLNKQLRFNQYNLVGHSTRVSLPNQQTDGATGDGSLRSKRQVNQSLMSYQKRNQKLNRSFLQKQDIQKNDGSSVERQTDMISSAETQGFEFTKVSTAKGATAMNAKKSFFEKRRTVQGQKDSVPSWLPNQSNNIQPFFPMPSIRGSTNTTNFESNIQYNIDYSQIRKLNQLDDYSMMKPMTPSSVIATPYHNLSIPHHSSQLPSKLNMSSAPCCNYQQLASDFNQIMQSFDDTSSGHIGNFISIPQTTTSTIQGHFNLKRQSTLNQQKGSEENSKIANQNLLNLAELNSAKQVFIGELSKDQFRSPRASNKPQAGRTAISVDKAAAAVLKKDRLIGSREQGHPDVKARGTAGLDQLREARKGSIIIKKMQEGIRNMFGGLSAAGKVDFEAGGGTKIEPLGWFGSTGQPEASNLKRKVKRKKSGDNDSSSNDSDDPLRQDEDRVRRYKCFSHDTQLLIREHEIFDQDPAENPIKITKQNKNRQRTIKKESSNFRQESSPFTRRLNLSLLNCEHKNTSQNSNALKLFLNQVELLNSEKLLEQQKLQQKSFDLGSIKKMFSKEPSVKQMRKLNLDEMHEIIKEKSQKIRDEVYVRASHLIQMHQKEHLHTLEPMKEKLVKLQPISALFLKLNVAGRSTPLIGVFKNIPSEEEQQLTQTKDKNHDTTDQIQIFWSYTNEFPCNGSPKEFDGSFKEEKILSIGNPQEHKFSQPHIYLGIYAKSKSFQDNFMYSFGENALKEIDLKHKLKKQQLHASASETAQLDSSGNQCILDQKSNRNFNTKQRLEKFKQDMHVNVTRMMHDEVMREEFYKEVTKIKNKRAESMNFNGAASQNAYYKNLKSDHSSVPGNISDQPVRAVMPSKILPSYIMRDGSSEESQQGRDREYNFQFGEDIYQNSNLRNVGQNRIVDPNLSLEIHLSQRKDRRAVQAQHIRQLEIQRYKYNVFLTLRHDILKKVKDEKLDELVAVLRERKFARLNATNAVLSKILAILWNGLRVIRIRNLQKNKIFLAVLRVFLSYRRFVKFKYGVASCGSEKRDQRIRRGFLTKTLTFQGASMFTVEKQRSVQIMFQFLRDRQKLYWGFTIRQNLVMQKLGVIRNTMNQKMRVFRTGMIAIIQEIDDSFQQVRQRIRMIKYPQRKQYDWLMEELKPVSGLISAALNLIPKTYYEIPQMPTAFQDESANEPKLTAEEQNQVYRVALHFFRYLHYQHMLNHLKWYVQKQTKLHIDTYGDYDPECDSVPSIKTFKTSNLLRYIDYFKQFESQFLDNPIFAEYLPTYPTIFEAAPLSSSAATQKAKSRRQIKKENPLMNKGTDRDENSGSGGIGPEGEEVAGNGEGEAQAASFQKIAKTIYKKNQDKKERESKSKKEKQEGEDKGSGDELERAEVNTAGHCDEDTLNRLYEEHKIPMFDFICEPKFDIKEVMKDCNNAYIALFQIIPGQTDAGGGTSVTQTPFASIDFTGSQFDETPKPWKALKGLNSLQLLYKVLIHYKHDTLQRLKNQKLQ